MYVMYAHMYVFMYLPLAHNGYNCAVNKILFYSILFQAESLQGCGTATLDSIPTSCKET